MEVENLTKLRRLSCLDLYIALRAMSTTGDIITMMVAMSADVVEQDKQTSIVSRQLIDVIIILFLISVQVEKGAQSVTQLCKFL